MKNLPSHDELVKKLERNKEVELTMMENDEEEKKRRRRMV